MKRSSFGLAGGHFWFETLYWGRTSYSTPEEQESNAEAEDYELVVETAQNRHSCASQSKKVIHLWRMGSVTAGLQALGASSATGGVMPIAQAVEARSKKQEERKEMTMGWSILTARCAGVGIAMIASPRRSDCRHLSQGCPTTQIN